MRFIIFLLLFISSLLIVTDFAFAQTTEEKRTLIFVKGIDLEISIDKSDRWGFGDVDISILDLTITNNHNEEINIFHDDLVLVDVENNQFRGGFYDDEFPECSTYLSGTIIPSTSKTFEGVCFQIPPDDRNYSSLIWDEEWMGCVQANNCKFSEWKLYGNTGNSEETPIEDDSNLQQEILELKEKIRKLEIANKKLQETIDELKKNSGTEIRIKKEIASFVESDKDPQSYIDRYNNEASYKEWFDENYSEYKSIHEAVGKRPPVPDWIKNNAIWWSEGKLSEDDFVNGIQYLVKERIIQVD